MKRKNKNESKENIKKKKRRESRRTKYSKSNKPHDDAKGADTVQ